LLAQHLVSSLESCERGQIGSDSTIELFRDVSGVFRKGEEHCLTRSGSFLFGSGDHRLASVERGNEEDIVALLNLVFLFSFELPIGIVDEYENARSSNGVSRIF
jgi:hypothetical protein